MKKQAAVVSILFFCSACSSDGAVDLGDDTPVRTGENLEDYAATWIGYTEAFEFGDGSDAVRLALDGEGNGSLEVGESEAVVQTDVDNPPGNDGGAPIADRGLSPGFQYSVRSANVESRRLRFGVLSDEIYRAWCELQTPILDEANSTLARQSYACVANWGFTGGDACSQTNPDTGEEVPIDCGKLAVCSIVCQCDAQSCGVPEPPELAGYQVQFDAALENDGEDLVGTLVLGSERITVRMSRD